jgi:uncharacterized DUF497 family protein
VAELRFTWDDRKAAANATKHGVSFEEAQWVFYDEHALVTDDPDHSEGEDRFLILGLSSALRILLVVYCEPSNEEIRLISARKANKTEQRQYLERLKK